MFDLVCSRSSLSIKHGYRFANAICMSPSFRYEHAHSVSYNKRMRGMQESKYVASAVPFESWIVASNVAMFDFCAVNAYMRLNISIRVRDVREIIDLSALVIYCIVRSLRRQRTSKQSSSVKDVLNTGFVLCALMRCLRSLFMILSSRFSKSAEMTGREDH